MANFDTAAKRYSGLCLGDMLPVTPIPDGTVGTADRLHFLDLYSGIAASPPVVIGVDGLGSSISPSSLAQSSLEPSSLDSSALGVR